MGEETHQTDIQGRCLGLLLHRIIKMCLTEFNAVPVAITHTGGTVAVHVLNGSPLQIILNIIELGVAGSCIISLIKEFNQMDFLMASNNLNDSYSVNMLS